MTGVEGELATRCNLLCALGEELRTWHEMGWAHAGPCRWMDGGMDQQTDSTCCQDDAHFSTLGWRRDGGVLRSCQAMPCQSPTRAIERHFWDLKSPAAALYSVWKQYEAWPLRAVMDTCVARYVRHICAALLPRRSAGLSPDHHTVQQHTECISQIKETHLLNRRQHDCP